MKRPTHCPVGHPMQGANLYMPPGSRGECRACQVTRDRAQRKQARK